MIAVAWDDGHNFSKQLADALSLIEGRGIEGDSHCGATVQHRSRVEIDPDQPNLRQVHLIHAELFDELADRGFAVGPGAIGDNIVTRGINLLGLPTDTVLRIGSDVALKVTGLRNPCSQIEAFMPGLLAAVVDKQADGGIVRKAGIMSVVEHGGRVKPGDQIEVVMPAGPHVALSVV